ncbi:MAG: hypothetical protein P8Y12_05355 [Gammaproteobacteria bacterium]
MTELILVKSDFDRFSEWKVEFRNYDLTAIPWSQRKNYQESVRYALVWQPEPGALEQLNQLEIIFSVGAGIDHLKDDGIVPNGIPVVRMVEDSLTAGRIGCSGKRRGQSTPCAPIQCHRLEPKPKAGA